MGSYFNSKRSYFNSEKELLYSLGELSQPLNWSYAGGSYYDSNLELNCTPLELNLTLFLELNFSLTLQGELN